MFRIRIEQEVGTTRVSEEDFVVAVTAAVLAFGDDMEPRTVGRFELDRILWADAQEHGFPLFDVCDCDSQGMYQLHAALTEPATPNDLRDDFELDAPTDEVLFLHRVALHPDLAPHRRGLLTALLAAFGGDTLAAVWQGVGGTPDAELFELGFRKVAGEKLLLRHSSFANRYAEKNPDGLDGDFVATEEHEGWLLAHQDAESDEGE